MARLEVELREQPAALARLLDREAGAVAALARRLGAEDLRYVLIAARGSSDNAARYAQYLLGAHNRLPVALAAPSLFSLYRQPPRLDGALVVGISQSGASPDVVSVLAEASAQGRPTLALTNTPDSDLARAARHLVPLHAGEEQAVAATKTYVNTLGAVALLSAALGPSPGERLAALQRAPALLDQTLAEALARGGEAAAIAGAPACAVVARGYNYATAFEVALKVSELSGMLATPFSGADLLHGPVGAVGSSFPVLLLAPPGATVTGLAALHATVRERGARTLVVTADPELLAAADAAIPLARDLPEWLSPMVAVVPGQVVAMRLALARGLDLDRPAGLQKVTRTR